MTTLRVAFAMGGGVSLGAFSGAALGEVVKQLIDNRDSRYDKVEFDVFSGTSAVSLSLALMIHTLADPRQPEDPETVLKRQHEAWVERIGIQQLIPDPKMDHVNSLLNPGAVNEIARDMLNWREGWKPKTRSLGDRVLFACTLSNLNGIPIDGRNQGEGKPFLDAKRTTLYSDLRVFDLRLTPEQASAEMNPTSDDRRWVRMDLPRSRAQWLKIAGTAVACGAFPLAFEPVALERSSEEYGALWPHQKENEQSFPFTFVDGGVFENEPLRAAMQLIARQDAGAQDIERILVLIDPYVGSETHTYALDYHRDLYIESPKRFLFQLSEWIDGKDIKKRPYTDRLIAAGTALMGAVKGQASYRDWLRADKVNSRLEWRIPLIEWIGKMTEKLSDQDVSELSAELHATLNEVLDSKGDRSTIRPEDLTSAREHERILRDWPDTLVEPSEGSRGNLLLNLVSLIDQVSGLRRKRSLPVVGIAPIPITDPQYGAGEGPTNDVPLAGDFMMNFGGFFCKEFREHDYLAGRAVTGYAIRTLLNDPTAREAAPPNLNVEENEDRKKAEKRLTERIEKVLGDLLKTKIRLPLWLDQVVGLFARKKAAGALEELIEEGVPYRPARVRIVVTPNDADDTFELEGQGGDDKKAVIGSDGLHQLETLIYYPTQTTHKFRGPHVTGKAKSQCLAIVETNGLNKERCLCLPDLDMFRELTQFGRGVIEARIDWRDCLDHPGDHPIPADWEIVETLREWPEKV